jgi:AraC-like DNA-binding protein
MTRPDLLDLFRRFVGQFSLDPSLTHLWQPAVSRPIAPGAHFHSDWEFRIVLLGRLPWPGGPEPNHPRCLIIPPGHTHHEMERDAPPRQTVILVLGNNGTWQFSENMQRCAFGVADPGLQRRLGGLPNDVMNAFADDDRVLDQPDVRAFWESRVRSLLLAFLADMTRPISPARHEPDDIVARARQFIAAEHSRSDLTVADIASAVGCTPTHLAHVFRRVTAKTVRRTLIEYRLERAAGLLKTGEYLVKEVAWLTGWRSPFHFSNSFAKRFGRRPSEGPEDRTPI